MRVRVMLFASHREAASTSRLELEVPEGSTVEDLFGVLTARYTAMEALRPYTSFAVNREFSPASTVLHDGDEVALMQPVSGGADV